MTRKRWLIVLGAVSLGLWVALMAVDPSAKADGDPGIVDWEFAWNEDGAREILDEWGEEGRDAARLSLRLDFVFLLAYGAFFALASAATRDLAAERGWRRMAGFGPAAIWAALGAAAFDAVEDVFLLIALDGGGGDVAPMLGSLFACGKFLLLAVTVLYVLSGLALRMKERLRR